MHPGGAHAIHLSEGLDCTALFLSYHPAEWTRRLNIYAVGAVSPKTVHGDTSKPPMADPLLVDLRMRVTKAMGPIRDLKTPAWGWAVNAVLVAVYTTTIYAWAVAPCVAHALACGFMGFICAGFLQHEGSHNALSHRQWVNNLGRYAIMPWADPAEWFRAHVATHHPYTNTALDPDFQHADPLVRHHPESRWQWTHRTMLAVLVAYGPVLSFFYSIDGRAAGSSIRRAIKPTVSDPSAWESRMYLVFVPAVIYSHYAVHGSLILAALPISAFGIFFLWITQLSHIQEVATPPMVYPDAINFVSQQLATTLDYSHGSISVTLLSIWLNHQAAHHLLPGISHYHFADKRFIAAFDEWRAAHGLPFHYEKSFPKVIGSHLSWIAKLSSRPGDEIVRKDD